MRHRDLLLGCACLLLAAVIILAVRIENLVHKKDLSRAEAVANLERMYFENSRINIDTRIDVIHARKDSGDGLTEWYELQAVSPSVFEKLRSEILSSLPPADKMGAWKIEMIDGPTKLSIPVMGLSPPDWWGVTNYNDVEIQRASFMGPNGPGIKGGVWFAFVKSSSRVYIFRWTS